MLDCRGGWVDGAGVGGWRGAVGGMALECVDAERTGRLPCKESVTVEAVSWGGVGGHSDNKGAVLSASAWNENAKGANAWDASARSPVAGRYV